MLVTGNKTVDLILTLLSYVLCFCFGVRAVFYYPSKTRKAIAEGKVLASEKTMMDDPLRHFCTCLFPVSIRDHDVYIFYGRVVVAQFQI